MHWAWKGFQKLQVLPSSQDRSPEMRWRPTSIPQTPAALTKGS